MTSLLLHWLNDELSLHRKVTILERDLSNGYILAEVLHIHGLEARLDRYSDDVDLATRVLNLENLSNALKAAGMGPLATQTIREILMENRSTILQLLLRIKDHVQSRGKKTPLQQQRMKSIPSRVYESRSLENPDHLMEDIEKRFVKDTAKAYRPSEVVFHKGINIAVHLRKFPQAQWQAENQAIEYCEKQKRIGAHQIANSMGKQRKHMSDKREFMRRWDLEHLRKWQATQRLHFAAERDDLRLELTLEERRRRMEAARLAKLRTDMTDGVYSFEKNVAHLGLNTSSASGMESNLRAIPCADEGPLVHFRRLEQIVKDLDFKPANNVKMMQELRARRTSQLAAEKDRRIRRMKAAMDATKTIVQTNMDGQGIPTVGPTTTIPDREDSVIESSGVEQTNLLQAFIDANRDVLEANYDRLRIQGAARRENDLNELEHIRCERRLKVLARRKSDCMEIIDDLIEMSIASVHSCPSRYNKDKEKIAKQNECSSSLARCVPVVRDSYDCVYEHAAFTETFVGFSDMWKKFADVDDLRCSLPKLSADLESFIRSALTTPSEDQLAVEWDPLCSPRVIALFTSDDRGHSSARRIATDHGLEYVNIEDILEECVKNIHDQGKQVDLLSPQPLRARILGAFGPRVLAFTQKNNPIPESLAVDIALAVLTASEQASSGNEHEATAENTTESRCQRGTGFLLHNFPRSIDEWKLFEKGALNANLEKLDADELGMRAAALEVPSSGDADIKYASSISCAIVISLLEQPASTPTTFSSAPSSAEVTGSVSERRRQTQNVVSDSSKRQSLVDPALIKAEAEMEARQQRGKLEDVLARTSRLVRIDQTQMNTRVLEELIHLAIDVYGGPMFRPRVGSFECASSVSVPEEINYAREVRRSAMPVQDRIAWMAASNQLQLSEKVLFDLLMRIGRVEATQTSNVRELFGRARRSMVEISQSMMGSYLALDAILERSSPLCAAILDQAADDLKMQRFYTDKVLTVTEVELGDVIECQRVQANRFITMALPDLEQSSLPHISSWLDTVPLVCLELKEYVVDTIGILEEEFYVHFSFLRRDTTHKALPVSVSPSAIEKIGESVTALELACTSLGINLVVRPEIERLVQQIAVVSQDVTVDTMSEELSSQLHLDSVARTLVSCAMRGIQAVLRWTICFVATVRSSQRSSLEDMRRYLSREIRLSSLAISRGVRRLAEGQLASWPKLPPIQVRLPELPTRHQRVAFLSPSQYNALIEAFKLKDSHSSGQSLFSTASDDFVATVIEVARQHEFPEPWHDMSGVARIAIMWAGDQHIPMSWRHVVFAMICSQAVGLPTTQDIAAICDQLRHKLQVCRGDSEQPLMISKQDYAARVRLWFEGQTSEDSAWKELLFSLFTTAKDTTSADATQMLFTWCAAPLYPRNIHPEIASALLPRFSRGLERVFRALLQWTEYGGVQHVGLQHMRRLLLFAGHDLDDSRLRTCDGEELSWGHHDATRFLAWCEEDYPAISHRFVLHDTFAALTDD